MGDRSAFLWCPARDNMVMMARVGRRGGRVAVLRGDNGVKARRARALALREAVRHG